MGLSEIPTVTTLGLSRALDRSSSVVRVVGRIALLALRASSLSGQSSTTCNIAELRFPVNALQQKYFRHRGESA